LNTNSFLPPEDVRGKINRADGTVNGAADNNDDREPTAAFGEAIDVERVSANETG
jgi:hypothetical protein